MNDKKSIEWMGALLGVMFFVLMIGRGGMEEIRDNLLWVALGAGAFVIVGILICVLVGSVLEAVRSVFETLLNMVLHDTPEIREDAGSGE